MLYTSHKIHLLKFIETDQTFVNLLHNYSILDCHKLQKFNSFKKLQLSLWCFNPGYRYLQKAYFVLTLHGWYCTKCFNTKTGSSFEALIFQTSCHCMSFLCFFVWWMFYGFWYAVINFRSKVFRTKTYLIWCIFAQAFFL